MRLLLYWTVALIVLAWALHALGQPINGGGNPPYSCPNNVGDC